MAGFCKYTTGLPIFQLTETDMLGQRTVFTNFTSTWWEGKYSPALYYDDMPGVEACGVGDFVALSCKITVSCKSQKSIVDFTKVIAITMCNSRERYSANLGE